MGTLFRRARLPRSCDADNRDQLTGRACRSGHRGAGGASGRVQGTGRPYKRCHAASKLDLLSCNYIPTSTAVC